MFCPNLSDPKIKQQFTQLENLHLDFAYYLWDKYEGEVPDRYYQLSSTQIKPGVEELFNENPELANQVYSKILTNSGISGENLLSVLLKENIIEKQCS